MSKNPLALKIADPYARAFFNYSLNNKSLPRIVLDCENLEVLFNNTPELLKYLSNPIVSTNAKRELLAKTLRSKISPDVFTFLSLLISRKRINFIQTILSSYLELVYDAASLNDVKVESVVPFGVLQRQKLLSKLRVLTKSRDIRLTITVNPTLIGGFLIKTKSKVIDFTVKNQLQNLAKHLDGVLEI